MTKIACCIAAVLALVAGQSLSAFAADPHVFVPAPYASAAKVTVLARKGDMNAEAQLGWMYATGRGVPQDFYKAAQWYYLAATKGQGWAQFQLGLLYNKGQGVPCNYVLSYMWLNLSASQAVGDDRDFRARIRDAVATKMTVAQVTQAQGMAMSWYNTH